MKKMRAYGPKLTAYARAMASSRRVADPEPIRWFAIFVALCVAVMFPARKLAIAQELLPEFKTPCAMACAEGPLPEFSFKGVAVDPRSLTWAPGDDIEHPAFIKMEGLVEKPLGKYYLYYGPHKHEGVGVMYADSLAGPWKEYEGNPVIKGAAAPGRQTERR